MNHDEYEKMKAERIAGIDPTKPHEHLWHIWMPDDRKGPPQIVANSPCAVCGLTPEAVANVAAIKTLLAEVEAWRQIGRVVAAAHVVDPM